MMASFGCGYRFGQGDCTGSYQTFTVPYIIGDTSGEFTAAVIKQVSEKTHLTYQKDAADLIIQIEIEDFNDENIGYRFERNRKDQLVDSIIPTETRLEVLAKMQMIEAETGLPILGPYRLKAHVDFDHDYYSSRHAVNVFSLGQVIDYDAAYDTALKPLSTLFAQKVADLILSD